MKQPKSANNLDLLFNELVERATRWGDAEERGLADAGEALVEDCAMTIRAINSYGQQAQRRFLDLLDHMNPYVALMAAGQSSSFDLERVLMVLNRIMALGGPVGLMATVTNDTLMAIDRDDPSDPTC